MSILVTVRLDTPEHADAELAAARLQLVRDRKQRISLATPAGIFPAYLVGVMTYEDEDPS